MLLILREASGPCASQWTWLRACQRKRGLEGGYYATQRPPVDLAARSPPCALAASRSKGCKGSRRFVTCGAAGIVRVEGFLIVRERGGRGREREGEREGERKREKEKERERERERERELVFKGFLTRIPVTC